MFQTDRRASPEIQLSWEEIAQLPTKVREICLRHGVGIRNQTDLAAYLEICKKVTAEKNSAEPFDPKLCQAQRVLSAIVACGDESELKEPLSRMASNTLDPTSKTPSPGKDALFELETLQYARHRRLGARLGEPDVIIEAPFGDYFVACKTINSPENFEKQLSRGCRQLDRLGSGCVAFNFEPQLSAKEPIVVDTSRKLQLHLDAQLIDLYEKHRRHIDKRLEDDRLDGVMLQISCYAKIRESTSALDVFTHTVFYSRSNLQQTEAHERFEGFKQSMQGPLCSFRS